LVVFSTLSPIAPGAVAVIMTAGSSWMFVGAFLVEKNRQPVAGGERLAPKRHHVLEWLVPDEVDEVPFPPSSRYICRTSLGVFEMNHLKARWALVVLAALAVVLFATQPLHAELLEKTTQVGGTTVHYKVVLPDVYEPAQVYPGVLVFGGGPQTMNTVDNVLTRNFRAEAERRGYIVIAPAAPDEQLFFEDGARIFPEFLKTILADYKIQGNKFHVAGPSNGGIAAFHVAADNPQYFLSVTAFPGYMWRPNVAKLQAISKMCIFMYVGEWDRYMWHDEMKKEVEFLRSKGTVARYTVEKGQPHRLDTLAGASAGRLFDGFEETKRGCSP
jgi:predicted esterase